MARLKFLKKTLVFDAPRKTKQINTTCLLYITGGLVERNVPQC
jgi:hypothetical protein